MLKLIKKILDVRGLVTATVLNTKVWEVENKIPNVSGLYKKTDYNATMSDTEQNILLLDAKSKEKGLVCKSDISNLVKN